MSRPIRVVVTGAGGRMGGRILNAVRAEDELEVVGATERSGSQNIGLDAGLLTGAGPLEVTVQASLEAALDQRAADVVIDFTTPQASLAHAQVCAARKVALVVGTTGFSAEQKAELSAYSKDVAVLMAPNMSAGVNVLFRLVTEAAKALGPAWECEIVELHHRQKRDAPSGTALRLAEAAALGLDLDPKSSQVHERSGDIGPRAPGTIGVQTLRGGDVVGEHTVYFIADGERIELTHRATSRDNFARGAVRAARYLAHKPAGLYDMGDVLGFGGRRA